MTSTKRPEIKVWRYRLEDGWEVLAGKTAVDNDRLSLKLAGANDWWFHVRGMPGSHVVLSGPGSGKPAPSILRQAAAIAAYHSKARNGGVVAVACTQAKNVSKPRGAKPGTVTIRKEKIYSVRPALPATTSAQSSEPDQY